MSLIPIRSRHGRHRATDKVTALEDDNRRLLRQLFGAIGAIAALKAKLADSRTKQADAEMKVVALDADVYELTAERDHLAETVAVLRRRFAAELAADANATAVTVPASVRDTTAVDDQATHPIDVRPLWDALGIRATPGNTSPAHIPPAA
ncbi:hypothetical protein [Streptomyces sp. NRRL F-5135]|uniref:hypothetical protein n=1 Tax=Streptomyces sp. NRRL F-5135 TaxID=1463858 RepID=UPI0004C88782|nr:hypothetical protein [Streptomyces sp. NRRL F-5135]